MLYLLGYSKLTDIIIELAECTNIDRSSRFQLMISGAQELAYEQLGKFSSW